jgi:cellulose synthase/poly-beta-1,6-N-acetylglucosamine synthase-like glycosyltransferase
LSETIWGVIGVFNYVVLAYFVLLNVAYLGTTLFALRALRRYALRLKSLDLSELITSGGAPSISLIAPAHDEALTCVESVRSLLKIEYPDFEVLVVNDSSKDDTVERLRAANAGADGSKTQVHGTIRGGWRGRRAHNFPRCGGTAQVRASTRPGPPP